MEKVLLLIKFSMLEFIGKSNPKKYTLSIIQIKFK